MQFLFQLAYLLTGGLYLLVEPMHGAVALAVVGHVDARGEVVGHLTLGIEDGADVELHVAVDALLGIEHVLAGMQVVAVGGTIGTDDLRQVEQSGRLPEVFVVGTAEAAYLAHVVVQTNEPTVLVVEGHSERGDAEQLVELPAQLEAGVFLDQSLGDIVNGIDEVTGFSEAVGLDHRMAVERQPSRCLRRSRIPVLAQQLMARASLYHKPHLLVEVPPFVGMYSFQELLVRYASVRQQVAVAVDLQVGLDVVLHHIEVTHVQGLDHHVVHVGQVLHVVTHLPAGQHAQCIEHGHHEQRQHDEADNPRQRAVLDALGMYPAVVYLLHHAALLQARIVVVNLVNEFLVTSDDVDFADGNVDAAQHQALDVEFLDFPLQRSLAPDEVLVVAHDKTHQCRFGRLVVNLHGARGVVGYIVLHGIVGGFEDRPFRVEHLERHPGGRVALHGHNDAVIVDDVLRHVVGGMPETLGVRHDDVGIAAPEGLDGVAPVLHHEAYGQVHLLHDGPHHFDVRAGWLALVVEVLVGGLVPVAGHDHGPAAVVAVVQRLCRSGKE